MAKKRDANKCDLLKQGWKKRPPWRSGIRMQICPFFGCFHEHDPKGLLWKISSILPHHSCNSLAAGWVIWQMVGGVFMLGNENLWRFEICRFETLDIS